MVDLREEGETVSKKTVEGSMARQGLFARPPRRRRRLLTKRDKVSPPAPDLLCRDFEASGPDQKWCGDLTEIGTDEGRLYLASTENLFSRRLLGFAMSEHPDAALARASLHMAVAAMGSVRGRVIFHSDLGSTSPESLWATAPSWEYASQWAGWAPPSTARILGSEISLCRGSPAVVVPGGLTLAFDRLRVLALTCR